MPRRTGRVDPARLEAKAAALAPFVRCQGRDYLVPSGTTAGKVYLVTTYGWPAWRLHRWVCECELAQHRVDVLCAHIRAAALFATLGGQPTVVLQNLQRRQAARARGRPTEGGSTT